MPAMNARRRAVVALVLAAASGLASAGVFAPEWGEPVQQKTEAVPTSAEAASAHALSKGDRVPEVTFRDAKGEPASLAAHLEKGPLVLIFYRGGWCSYCVKQLKEFEAAREKLAAEGATVVAVSTEVPEYVGETAEKSSLGFPVLSDPGAVASRAFGVAWANAKYAKPLAKYQGNDKGEIVLGATYVIDRDGVIRYAYNDSDYTERATPDAVLEVLRSID